MQLASAVFLMSSASALATGITSPWLEDLSGAPSLRVQGASGAQRLVKAGAQLEWGDTLATPKGVAARLSFSPEIQMVVGEDSQIAVQATAEPPPEVVVERGTVRGWVEAASPAVQPSGQPSTAASPGPGPSAAPTTAKPRFILRTPSVIMGVRGTDFVVRAKGDAVELATLNGTVEYAPVAKSWPTDGGKKVGAGWVLKSAPTVQETDPEPFVEATYLKTLHTEQPKMAALAELAKKEATEGLLKKRFEQRAETSEPAATSSPDPSKAGLIEFRGKPKPTLTPRPRGAVQKGTP